jgi:arylsulfatase A-like enzyme
MIKRATDIHSRNTNMMYQSFHLFFRSRVLFIATLLISHFATFNFAAERPNILYIFTDDQSVRTLSCYNDTPDAYLWAKTPNIDQLARHGVRFTTCYTGAKCLPSRGLALTGKLQSGFDKGTPYWPTKLREHGYYTGMIGKWHFGVPRHGVAWDWSVVWPHYLGDSNDDAEGSDYYNNQQVSIDGGPLVPLGGYSTDRYVDYTVKFLEARAQDKTRPWFYWLCFAGVHGPYTPADRHLKEYLDAPATEIPVDIFGPRPEKPEHDVMFSRWKAGKNNEPVRKDHTLDEWVKQYNQAVCALDEGVGRIMQTLRETNQLDNTIVIYTADQGFAWGQHGYQDKQAPYDANLLAPLIVTNPRFLQNEVCAKSVTGIDIIATIQKLTGLENSPNDGRDFSPLLMNPKLDDWTIQPTIQMYTGSLFGDSNIIKALKKGIKNNDWSDLIADHKMNLPSWIMMREGKYKYVRYMAPNYIEELYDLESDPLELINLALRQVNHELLSKLRDQCLAAVKVSGAKFIDLLPAPKIVAAPPSTVNEKPK